MDKLLADSTVLDSALLGTDEEQYDKQAQALVSKLSKTQAEDLALKDALDVCSCSHVLTFN